MKIAAELRALRGLISGANPYLSREDERPRPVAFARTGKLGRTMETKKPAAGLPARAAFLR